MNQFATNSEINEVSHSKPIKKQSWWGKIIKICVLIIILAIFFIAGFISKSFLAPEQVAENNIIKYTAQELSDIFKNNQDINVDLFAQVWAIIHEDYFKKHQINDREIFYGAISGMVEALGDPYSHFLDPEVTKDFTQELDGSFFGIGAEIGRKNGFLLIISSLANTPADKAGIRSGDRILAIDGLDTAEMSVTEAVYMIRGPQDTEVVLTIFSKEDNSTKDITIRRDKIDIPSVVYTLEDNIAYVQISHFNSDTDSRFSKVAQKIISDDPQAIILDLRNNPGGLLDIAVDISSYWLEPDAVVVREIFQDKSYNRDYKASAKPSLAHFKTIVLINENSASAAEILAGALQDYELATLIGQKTFGKGSVQQLIALEDDSSLKLTIAEWLTPKGRTIDEEGIIPDEEIELTWEDYNNNLDPQLDRAKKLIYP